MRHSPCFLPYSLHLHFSPFSLPLLLPSPPFSLCVKLPFPSSFSYSFHLHLPPWVISFLPFLSLPPHLPSFVIIECFKAVRVGCSKKNSSQCFSSLKGGRGKGRGGVIMHIKIVEYSRNADKSEIKAHKKAWQYMHLNTLFFLF